MLCCLRNEGSAILKRKLVVIGDGMCGKSCMLHRLSHGEFDVNGYIPTIVDTDVAEIECEGKMVELMYYDTAGQENYDRLRPLSYPKTDVILLCFALNDRNSFDNVTGYWLPEVKEYCEGVPIILVGTKKDTKDEGYTSGSGTSMFVTSSEGQAVASTIGARCFMECSAKTGVGIDDIFKRATKEAINPVHFKKNKTYQRKVYTVV